MYLVYFSHACFMGYRIMSENSLHKEINETVSSPSSMTSSMNKYGLALQ